MERPSETETVRPTVRMTGFEKKKYTHWVILIPCVRSLFVVGSRIRPVVLRVG